MQASLLAEIASLSHHFMIYRPKLLNIALGLIGIGLAFLIVGAALNL
jgi:hypothetical protein